MTTTNTTQPDVTIIVTPREKWSICNESLDSILEHTTVPFRLVYVDGGSPAVVRRHVDRQAAAHGFTVIRTRRFLKPNEARLMGLEKASTPYVAFVDNDVIASPRWMETMLDCARESGAAVVSPLICQGQPLHSIIHCAGGECGVKEIEAEGGTERHLFEKIAHQGREVVKMRPRLARAPVGLAEFHCMLVRTEVARQPGMIDPGILNTREHIDFCMGVKAAGHEIWLEPDSVVTYLHDSRLRLSDMPYFMLRWSDGWERRSLQHVIAKWNLTTRGTAGYRLANVGWRRRQYLVAPMAERLTGALPQGRVRGAAQRIVMGAERRLNGLLNRVHDLRAGRPRR
jgi:GT2 family glycosyltransferase